MYNPFKAHIAVRGDQFCVRRFALTLGWVAYSLRDADFVNPGWWEMDDPRANRTTCGTLDECRQALSRLTHWTRYEDNL